MARAVCHAGAEEAAKERRRSEARTPGQRSLRFTGRSTTFGRGHARLKIATNVYGARRFCAGAVSPGVLDAEGGSLFLTWRGRIHRPGGTIDVRSPAVVREIPPRRSPVIEVTGLFARAAVFFVFRVRGAVVVVVVGCPEDGVFFVVVCTAPRRRGLEVDQRASAALRGSPRR